MVEEPVWNEELGKSDEMLSFLGGENSVNKFNGKIDEFKIYNRVLWKDEIIRLHL